MLFLLKVDLFYSQNVIVRVALAHLSEIMKIFNNTMFLVPFPRLENCDRP
jgi:hypothetical protein